MKDFLGFRPKRSVSGSGALPPVERMVIIDSTTLREGGALNMGASGVEDLDGASEDFLGYCVGFEDAEGFSHILRTTKFTGTYTTSAQGDTYVSDATNDDDGGDNIGALVIMGLGVICSGRLNADAGDTAGSNLLGYYLDIDTGNEELLDESSANTTKATFFLMPGVSNRLATDPEHPESVRRVMVLARELQQVTA